MKGRIVAEFATARNRWEQSGWYTALTHPTIIPHRPDKHTIDTLLEFAFTAGYHAGRKESQEQPKGGENHEVSLS